MLPTLPPLRVNAQDSLPPCARPSIRNCGSATQLTLLPSSSITTSTKSLHLLHSSFTDISPVFIGAPNSMRQHRAPAVPARHTPCYGDTSLCALGKSTLSSLGLILNGGAIQDKIPLCCSTSCCHRARLPVCSHMRYSGHDALCPLRASPLTLSSAHTCRRFQHGTFPPPLSATRSSPSSSRHCCCRRLHFTSTIVSASWRLIADQDFLTLRSLIADYVLGIVICACPLAVPPGTMGPRAAHLNGTKGLIFLVKTGHL